MAKKKIEEMNEQELAAEKAANPKIEVVSNASDAKTEHPMIRPEVKETIDVAPIAGGTLNESGNVVPAPLNKNVQAKIDTRTEMQKRREENSKRWVDTIEAKEKELGRALTSQEIMDMGDAKGLWAYQALNNKGANWGNLAGGAFVGGMNNNTYNILRRELDARAKKTAATEKENNHWNKEIAIVPVGDELVRVNRGMQNEMTTWGSQIKDPNYITPEQATTLYDKLQSYGIAVPKKTVTVADENGKPTKVEVYDIDDNGTSLAELVGNLGIEAQDVMQVLGFYDDDDNLKVPHKETFEEIMARREKAEEAMRLQAQQRELQRQQARLGLADLAAGIGDMIKASGGAIVTPRDYQAMYNSLTEQQKTNYNNYLARMQALKEQEKAKQKEAADRAYQERLLAEQRAYQEEQARKAQEFQASESKKNREHQESMLSDRLEAQKEIQRLKNQNAIDRLHLNIDSKEASNSAKYGTSIPFDGEIIPIKPNLSDGLYQGIYGYIEPAIRNHPAFVNELASIDKAYLETDPKAVRVIVANALTNPTVNITAEMKATIRKLINDAKEQQEEGNAGSNSVTIPKEANLVEQAVSASPEDIVTSWWKP